MLVWTKGYGDEGLLPFVPFFIMYTVLLSLLVKYSGQYDRGKGKSYRFNGVLSFSSEKNLREQVKYRLLVIIYLCMKLHNIFHLGIHLLIKICNRGWICAFILFF